MSILHDTPTPDEGLTTVIYETAADLEELAQLINGLLELPERNSWEKRPPEYLLN